jgi:hypothetical protein
VRLTSDAGTIIWIAKAFRDEHRVALDQRVGPAQDRRMA